MVYKGKEYLFHYTTIEKLALILKNKTIRLNSLCNMDDLQESKAEDLRHLGRFFFVSSWTDEDEESIPMWNLYTKMDAGVRIGLPKNPFVFHGTKLEDLSKALNAPVSGEGELKTFLNIADMVKKKVFSSQAWGGDILTQVIYTDEKSLLEPKTVSTDNDQIHLELSKIGKYKNKYWDFQKEWRYMMMFIPFAMTNSDEKMFSDFNQIGNRIALDKQPAPFDFYDLDISSDAMKSMLITPSPKMTNGNRILMESLIEKYNQDIELIESELEGLIR